MPGRGHGRRATLVAATVLAVALLGAAAHADPGALRTPVIPGQGAIDRAKEDVRDRQSAPDRIQQALDAVGGRRHAGSLHDFAVRRQAPANHDAAEALVVSGARQAAKDAVAARQKPDQTAADQRRAQARAESTLGAARAAAAGAQSRMAGIPAQQDALPRQLAAAQVEVRRQRQPEAGPAELAAPRAAAAPGPAPAPDAESSVRLMLNYIYAQLGKPYVWGGAGPDVFDCSGLAMRGLEAGGWTFPHPAQSQYLAMRSLTYNQLRPGDLVFWAEDDSDPHTIYHEAVYIGNDRIIQAPHPGGVVEQQSLWVNGTPDFYGRP